LGKIIRQKRKFDSKNLVVLIKPGSTLLTKMLSIALDEMLINGVTRYGIVDLERDEKSFLNLVN